jgi:beta-lactamase superfamily II metal-dependent hydrolase
MINGSPASYKLDSNGNAVKSTSGTPTNPPSTDSKKQKIHFIKQAGAGDAILLESNGHFAMIDVGVPGSNNDCSIVTNYLKNNNVSKLDFILITHAHNDHMGCGESVISKYSVSNLYIKELYSNGKNVSKTIKNQYNNLINTAKNKKITINYVNRDSNSDTYVKSLKMGDMSIKLYNTKQRMDKSPWNGNNELYNNENNNSIMALVTVNSKKTFLTGDMEDVNIMKKIVPDLVKSIDVLKLHHHGKGAKEEKDQGFTICGLNKSLLNNLKPSYLVATNTSKKVFDDAYSCFNQAGFKKVDNRTYTKGKNAFAVQDYSKAVIFDYSSSSVSASTK